MIMGDTLLTHPQQCSHDLNAVAFSRPYPRARQIMIAKDFRRGGHVPNQRESAVCREPRSAMYPYRRSTEGCCYGCPVRTRDREGFLCSRNQNPSRSWNGYQIRARFRPRCTVTAVWHHYHRRTGRHTANSTYFGTRAQQQKSFMIMKTTGCEPGRSLICPDFHLGGRSPGRPVTWAAAHLGHRHRGLDHAGRPWRRPRPPVVRSNLRGDHSGQVECSQVTVNPLPLLFSAEGAALVSPEEPVMVIS
jgi:hypothetical protein